MVFHEQFCIYLNFKVSFDRKKTGNNDGTPLLPDTSVDRTCCLLVEVERIHMIVREGMLMTY